MSFIKYVGELVLSATAGAGLEIFLESLISKIKRDPSPKEQFFVLNQILEKVGSLDEKYSSDGLKDLLVYFKDNFYSLYSKVDNLDNSIVSRVLDGVDDRLDKLETIILMNWVDAEYLNDSGKYFLKSFVKQNFERLEQTIEFDENFDLSKKEQLDILSKSCIDNLYQIIPNSQIEGGFGVVFQAIDKETDDRYILKFPLRYEFGERLADEFKVLSVLKGLKGVVDVVGGNCEGKFPYFAMAYYGKETLVDYLKHSDECKIKLSYDLLDSIKGIHDRGFSHRDIKLDNVLVKDDKTILTDFGCVKRIRKNELDIKTRNLDGNIHTTDPDIINGNHPGDELSDIYSFGAMLYQLFTEKPLDARKTAKQELISTGKKSLDKIIRKCTHIERSKRYQRVKEIMDDFSTEFGYILQTKNDLIKRNKEFEKSLEEDLKDVLDEYGNFLGFTTLELYARPRDMVLDSKTRKSPKRSAIIVKVQDVWELYLGGKRYLRRCLGKDVYLKQKNSRKILVDKTGKNISDNFIKSHLIPIIGEKENPLFGNYCIAEGFSLFPDKERINFKKYALSFAAGTALFLLGYTLLSLNYKKIIPKNDVEQTLPNLQTKPDLKLDYTGHEIALIYGADFDNDDQISSQEAPNFYYPQFKIIIDKDSIIEGALEKALAKEPITLADPLIEFSKDTSTEISLDEAIKLYGKDSVDKMVNDAKNIFGSDKNIKLYLLHLDLKKYDDLTGQLKITYGVDLDEDGNCDLPIEIRKVTINKNLINNIKKYVFGRSLLDWIVSENSVEERYDNISSAEQLSLLLNSELSAEEIKNKVNDKKFLGCDELRIHIKYISYNEGISVIYGLDINGDGNFDEIINEDIVDVDSALLHRIKKYGSFGQSLAKWIEDGAIGEYDKNLSAEEVSTLLDSKISEAEVERNMLTGKEELIVKLKYVKYFKKKK